MEIDVEELSGIHPGERVLLLPHCLRQSNSCRASYDSHGLQCAGCNSECAVNKLRKTALECGYKGVCVAPGGHLAIKYIREVKPLAVVAVACQKELAEGVQGVNELAGEDIKPVIVIVPLIKDGCIDTEVNDKMALQVISAGCSCGSPVFSAGICARK